MYTNIVDSICWDFHSPCLSYNVCKSNLRGESWLIILNIQWGKLFWFLGIFNCIGWALFSWCLFCEFYFVLKHIYGDVCVYVYTVYMLNEWIFKDLEELRVKVILKNSTAIQSPNTDRLSTKLTRCAKHGSGMGLCVYLSSPVFHMSKFPWTKIFSSW